MATYSYVKNGKIRLLKDPDLTDVDSDSSEEEQQESHVQQSNVDSFWSWESDYGYKPYQISVSKKLEQLNIGETCKLYINNTTYEIKKTAYDKAIQTNINNGLYRKAIRQSNKTNNDKNTEYKSKHVQSNHNNNNNNNNDTVKELQYVWFYSDNNGALQSCDYNTSKQLNNLQIGGLYKTYQDNTQYIFSKSGADLCQRRNGSSNECHSVIRQSVGNNINSVNKNKNNNNVSVDEYKKNKNNHAWNPAQHHHHHKKKWHWKNDKGKYQLFSNYIASKLDSLQINASIVVTINNSKYQMTKITHEYVKQRNINSGNMREVHKL